MNEQLQNDLLNFDSLRLQKDREIFICPEKKEQTLLEVCSFRVNGVGVMKNYAASRVKIN